MDAPAADLALLKRCRPLSDPVRFFANVLRFWLIVALTLATSAVVIGIGVTILQKGSSSSGGIVVVLIGLAGVLGAPLGVWMFFRSVQRPAVIYLRAFRSDLPARRLRSLLKAALGDRFRLCGIRPPQKRSGIFTRLFARGWIAFRYIGSEHFELEAEDHNWMARLLASYAKSRFVFIDVRDLTKHVEDEIRLSYLAMGRERCVFLIDPSRTEEEWLATIQTLVGEKEDQDARFQFLAYPGDERVDPPAFVKAARDLIDQIPSGRVAISSEAIAFARARVSEKCWATPFSETDLAGELLTLGIGAGLFVGSLFFSQFGLIAADILNAIGVAGLVIFLLAWGRAWKQAGVEKRLRRAGTRNPRSRLIGALVLIFFSPAIIGLLAISIYKLSETVVVAKNYAVKTDLQNIKTQLTMYEAMNGFIPTTEQGLQVFVTQPTTEPKPSRWFQLFHDLPKDPWGNDYIYRAPGRKHPKSYDLFSAGPDRKPDTADDDWGEE